MTKYIFGRIGTSLVVLFVLSALIFFAGRGLVDGNPALLIAGSQATPARIAELEHHFGYDRPIFVQYFDWLFGVLRGDWGTSPISGLKTTQILQQQIPVSFELATMSLIVAILIGVPLGVLAAKRAGSAVDVTIRVPMILLFAIPGFITGTIAIILATNFLTNLYSPTYIPFQDSPSGNLQTMLLPAIAVGIPTAPLIMQMTRAAMLEVLHQPFVTSARVNGLSDARVTYGYALRAALPPIVTFVGFTFGALIGGLLIVEQIFSLPGLGRGILQSISSRDFVQLNAQALVLAGSFIAANLIVDLLVPALDRRIARK
ncbi:ABC transporter permease [Microbacterium capsulatum]|uniref:ABC transporter permease n=1 Tax=Microbacterium capsulatum TaxID=3041921 RepID=A0ABU0XHD6_9MICO|nr:ABC transporter permease [Microbacterium sp. ASV81]MDQ4214538.1 ABC transporter permease [Microbacterium sp. ASV81]